MRAFHNSKLKLERARSHINALATEVSSLSLNSPCRFVIENDCDPSFKVVKLRRTRSLPENISLIFGDSVHNLRSALDHLAYELVTIETSKTREVLGENLLKDIMFPIAKDSKDLEKKIRSRQMQRAGEPVVKALRELRPYPKGNDGIITLNYLDIRDKHRLIIPVIEATVPSLSTITDSSGTYTIQIDADQPIEFDKELWRIRSNSFGSRGPFPPISIDVGLPIGTPGCVLQVGSGKWRIILTG